MNKNLKIESPIRYTEQKISHTTTKVDIICRTPITLELCCGLISPYESNKVNSSITFKPSSYVRFGLTMAKCTFTSPLLKGG